MAAKKKKAKEIVPACPKCGAPAVPILYGEPSEEAFEAKVRGEIVIGGCTIDLDEDGRATNPAYRCKRCRHEFGRIEGFDSKAAGARVKK